MGRFGVYRGLRCGVKGLGFCPGYRAFGFRASGFRLRYGESLGLGFWLGSFLQ